MKACNRYYLIFWVFIFCFSSCQESREKQIYRLVQEWTDKEIFFPKNPVFTIQGRDTVSTSEREQFSVKKVLVYVDSVGCMSCRLQLPKWKEFITEVDSLLPDKVSFLFYLYPKDIKEMKYILRRDAFRHPVCIDTDNAINTLNHFPEEDAFQTFLLDEKNRVMAMGNPIHNPKVKELYLSLLTGKRMNTSSEKLTTVVSSEVINLGKFPWKEKQIDSLQITNTGKYPFVIHDVVTNCGCLQAQFDRKPIRPGERMNLFITYRADHPEVVDKTLHIYGNMEGDKLTVSVKGYASKDIE